MTLGICEEKKMYISRTCRHSSVSVSVEILAQKLIQDGEKKKIRKSNSE